MNKSRDRLEMSGDNSIKRLALYVFWEEKGVVRDYVTFYLRALKELAADVVCIANGGMAAEGKTAMAEMGVDVLERANEGLDYGAWQAALQHLGWDNVLSYDEIIFCNCSCYGPVYPLEEAFAVMANRDCDFWGMTRHPERRDIQIIANDSSSVIYEHVQSYFIVCRKGAIINDAFKQWWEKLESYNDFHSEVAYHECRFTKYLSEVGSLKYCSYAEATKYNQLTSMGNPSMLQPMELLKDRMPLIKRKLFADTAEWLTPLSVGQQPRQVLDFLAEHTDYPEAHVWEDLLATRKMSSVKDAVHLNYILPAAADAFTVSTESADVACICYGYYPDLAEYMCGYIKSMPANASIYIISSREDTLDAYRQELNDCMYRNVEYMLKPNRGRDISALLVTSRDIVPKHDIICYVHDKKSPHANSISMGDFSYHCMECNLTSPSYVNEVINLFQENEKLGMLMPPTIHYANFTVLGAESDGNKDSMKEAYDMMKLTCPFDDAPVAPYGTCFWARGKALSPLYRRDWVFDDFPEEPMPSDGTLSHGIERVLPLAVQDAGFYAAWCSPDTYASLYMNNIAFMMRAYNKRLYTKYGRLSWSDMLQVLNMADNSENMRARLAWATSKLLKRKKRYYRIIDVLTLGLFHKIFKKKIQIYRNKLEVC